MALAYKLLLFTSFFYLTTCSNNHFCSKESNVIQSHRYYPHFGGTCERINGELQFSVKYCSFPRNNITITDDKIVQRMGTNFAFRCFFSKDYAIQQIIGCKFEGKLLKDGETALSKHGKRFACTHYPEGSWYLNEVEITENIKCTKDLNIRGVHYKCVGGKLEAEGCIMPYSSDDKILKDGETFEQIGHFKFECKKDATLKYKLEILGCTSSKNEFIRIGEKFKDDDVEISCKKNEDGQIVRQESLTSSSSQQCVYYGQKHKESEEFTDKSGMTVYRCEQGVAVKIACIAKTNRFNAGRIFYCFDNPFYCTPSGTGPALFFTNGCESDGTLVKATRTLTKSNTFFQCIRGPFDPNTQTYTFHTVATGCVAGSMTIAMNNYTKIDGKWKYCDISTDPDQYTSLIDPPASEIVCAETSGNPYFCKLGENFEESELKDAETLFGNITNIKLDDQIGMLPGIQILPFTQPVIRTLSTRMPTGSNSYSTVPGTSVNPYPEPTKHIDDDRQTVTGRPGGAHQSTTRSVVDVHPTVTGRPVNPYPEPTRHIDDDHQIVTGRPVEPTRVVDEHVTTTEDCDESEVTRRRTTTESLANSPDFMFELSDEEEELLVSLIKAYKDRDTHGFQDSTLTDNEKTMKYKDTVDNNLCSMLSTYCIENIAVEAITRLNPEQEMLKPLLHALASPQYIKTLMFAIKMIGKTGQYQKLNEGNYHMKQLFNFTLNRLCQPDTPCSNYVMGCFEGNSRTCSNFDVEDSSSNCLMRTCPLSGYFDVCYLHPVDAVKPLVKKHLCPYTCAQWLTTPEREKKELDNMVKSSQIQSTCIMRKKESSIY